MISPNPKLKSKFQYLEDEIKINIFKYDDYPLNLALTCRNWSIIAKDPYAKSEWLIVHYGKAHALFHAVRLGPTFVDIPVCKTLIARKVILSRYFIQRLLMHFGIYDQKLIEPKIEHNVRQLDTDRIRAFQKKIKSPWASNLPIFVFIYLLEEGYKQLANVNEDLPSKGNNMELFHFLSASPHVIDYATVMLKKYLKDTQDLILNKRFSPRTKALKSFGFLQQECFLRPLTILPLFINNIGIFGARPLSRSIDQRRRQEQNNQLRRQQRHQPNARRCQLYARRRRIYQRRQPNAPINNEDLLNRIINLPQQQITNDPLINEFFNGFSFI